MSADAPLLEATGLSKSFGSVVALTDVAFRADAGRITCLLGDNGAGKSTLIKILSGVYPPDVGTIRLEGREIRFDTPREALDRGLSTVFQDLALVPLMSVSRNFFLGREPTRGRGPFRRFDVRYADRVTREELSGLGIQIEDPSRPVGALSGGQRQSVAIARAVHFGAKVLILDEPASALGVRQAAQVLLQTLKAKERGVGIVFITHNVQHAMAVGDTFTVLAHGRVLGNFEKSSVTVDELETLMGGGQEVDDIETAIQAAAAGELLAN